MWKPFLETHFFEKLSRGIFSSPIQNLVILCEENEVKFRREKIDVILVRGHKLYHI